jgi:hypothetical protein
MSPVQCPLILTSSTDGPCIDMGFLPDSSHTYHAQQIRSGMASKVNANMFIYIMRCIGFDVLWVKASGPPRHAGMIVHETSTGFSVILHNLNYLSSPCPNSSLSLNEMLYYHQLNDLQK